MRVCHTHVALMIVLTGCVPSYPVVDQPPSIQATYASRLSQIKTGTTSTGDFQKLFPEAYPGGQNGDTTAYEIRDTQIFIMRADVRRPLDTAVGIYSPQQTVTQVLWFYFYNDLLVKWGRPQDWPTNPDLIIEKRNR